MGTSTWKDFATKADIVGVYQKIAELRAEMHTELKSLELRLTVRLTGAMIAIVGLAVAILKLFP